MIPKGTHYEYKQTPPANIEDLGGIRLCIIIQVGTRVDTGRVQNFSSSCGGPVSFTSAQRRYKWKVVELDIPVRNLR
jgi:hypothetical protein